MNFMNIPAIKNQQQTLIKRNFDKIYAHEAAHKRAGGALAGAIVIEKKRTGNSCGRTCFNQNAGFKSKKSKTYY